MTSDYAPRAPLAPRSAAGASEWKASLALPSASEQALHSLGAACFQVFLVAQFFSLTRLFFSRHLGDGVTAYASQAGLLSVALLFPAVLAYGLRSGSLFGTLVAPARLWAFSVLALSAGLTLYGGLGKGHMATAVAHDLAPYLVIVSAAVLGSVGRAWDDSDRLVLALFLVGVVVSALGMREMTQVVSEEYADDRAGISIVAYRMQGALAFWPLLLLTARRRRPLTAFLIFAGVFFVFAQQILFQKRSPSVRVLLFVLVFLLIVSRRGPRPKAPSGTQRVRGVFAVAAVLALLVSLTLAPWLFEGQAAGLLRRLSGQAYRGGAAGMLTWENERFFEAAMFFRALTPQELVFGRGFGGYFVPDTPGWGVWMDDVHAVARRQLHVGGLMPFFKGGLALSLVYYAGLALALRRGSRFLREPLSAAAFFVVLLHALFLLQEGWFTMSVSFDLVMVGLCMGHLLSQERHRRPRGPARGGLLVWPPAYRRAAA